VGPNVIKIAYVSGYLNENYAGRRALPARAGSGFHPPNSPARAGWYENRRRRKL